MSALEIHAGPVHHVLPKDQDCYLDRLHGREQLALLDRILDVSGEPLDVVQSAGCDESGWYVVCYEQDEVSDRRIDPSTGEAMVRTVSGIW